MKIAVITGSPHKNGTTALLADRFIEGARSKGHEIYRFDAAFRSIHPCLGCDACGMSGPCVQKDDIEGEAVNKFVEADLIALVSPVYYFGMTSQIKTVIDRFYSRTYNISSKQSVLLTAAGSDNDLTMRSIIKHYETLAGYMRWRDRGRVLAAGCSTREDAAGKGYADEAFRLGQSV